MTARGPPDDPIRFVHNREGRPLQLSAFFRPTRQLKKTGSYKAYPHEGRKTQT